MIVYAWILVWFQLFAGQYALVSPAEIVGTFRRKSACIEEMHRREKSSNGEGFGLCVAACRK